MRKVTLPKASIYSNARLFIFKRVNPLLLRTRQTKRVPIKAVHTLKEGEDITVIATKYYDNPRKWGIIADYNRIKNPLVLTGIETLNIPDL